MAPTIGLPLQVKGNLLVRTGLVYLALATYKELCMISHLILTVY